MEAARAGEFRRVNLVYFLSRNGRVEHPHLIRVHRLHRHGVRLRDVKRWLAEIRGKEMPNSFAWSYKRRYRNGYVWQDLIDDDLITPFSDNEYVIKGSELIVNPPPTSDFAQRRLVSLEEEKEEEEEEEASEVTTTTKAGAETIEISAEEDDQVSLKCSPPSQLTKQLDEESSSSSGAASDESSGRWRAVFKKAIAGSGTSELQKSGRASLLVGGKDDGGAGNYSKRATEALWNILTCREAGANEAVLLPSVSRRGHGQSYGSTVGGRTSSNCGGDDTSSEEEKAGGSGGKGTRREEGNGVHPAVAHKPSAASSLCS